MVVPPLMTGQFAVAEAKQAGDGSSIPVAVVFWAFVSAEAEERLSQILNLQFRLRPDEWQSGDRLWIVDTVGDARVLPELLQQLANGPLKGRSAKIRAREPNGQFAIKIVSHTG